MSVETLQSPTRRVERPLGYAVAATAGAIGTALIALSSVSTGVIPVGTDTSALPVLGRLAELPTTALVLALVGIGLLATGWLVIGSIITADRGRGYDVGTLYRTGALWTAPLLFVPPMYSDDLYFYMAQGAVAEHGLDPYAGGPADALGPDNELARNVSDYWRHSPAPYGPVFLAIAQFVSRVTGNDILAGLTLHRIIALSGILLIAWALPKLVRRTRAQLSTAVWLAMLNPMLLLHIVGGVHNDALMIGLVLVGVELALRAVEGVQISYLTLGAGVLLCATAVSIKLPAVAGLAVVVAVLARRWGGQLRHLVGAGVLVGAMAAVMTAVFSVGSGLGFGWIDGLSTPGAVASWLAPTNQFGFVVGWLAAPFGLDITHQAIGVGKIAGVVLAVVIGFVLVIRMISDRLPPVKGLALLLGLLVVFGPVVQPWYLLWCVIPAAAAAAPGLRMRALALASAALAFVVPPLGVAMHGDVLGIVLAYVCALGLLAALIAGWLALRDTAAVDTVTSCITQRAGGKQAAAPHRSPDHRS